LQTLSGIADPTAAVRACLAGGSGSFRRDIPFEVRFSPALNVSVPGGTVSERERCVAAVLGSTNWPSTRPFDVVFADGASSAAAAATESWPYFEPEGERLAALPPDIVKDALSSRKAAVAACWESAIARRSALSGGRTVRFRIRNQTTRAWVVSNASDAPAASPDALLDRCLVEVVQKLTLSMDGEGVYSWVFAERG
jgi:hypothetical protein